MEILTSYLEQMEKLATKEDASETLRTLISKASKLAAGGNNDEFNKILQNFNSA